MERAKGIRGWRSGLTVAGCLTLSVLALLLWGKLKLVTGAPRTAYADPELKAPEPKPAAAPKPAPAPPKPAAAHPADRPDLRGD